MVQMCLYDFLVTFKLNLKGDTSNKHKHSFWITYEIDDNENIAIDQTKVIFNSCA